MKKLLLSTLLLLSFTAVKAQTNKEKPWENTNVFGLRYDASFDFADKGSFGIEYHYLHINNSLFGFSFIGSGIYSLATKKWLDSPTGAFGPNISVPLSKNFILYAPLCATFSPVTEYGETQTYHYKFIGDHSYTKQETKTYWGMSFTPTLGLRLGRIMLSAGWNMSYGFKTEKFGTKAFTVGLSYCN